MKDCRCELQDDFENLLNLEAELSWCETDDAVFLCPSCDSVLFQTQADLDVQAALKKEQMALLCNVVSVKVRVKAKPPFRVLSVESCLSGNATIDLNIQAAESGVGTTIKQGAQTSGTKKIQRAKDIRGAGFADTYRIVPLNLLTQRVLKYAVRLHEQSLRATEAMPAISSHQVRFDCVVCQERFAVCHPAYEPPHL